MAADLYQNWQHMDYSHAMYSPPRNCTAGSCCTALDPYMYPQSVYTTMDSPYYVSRSASYMPNMHANMDRFVGDSYPFSSQSPHSDDTYNRRFFEPNPPRTARSASPSIDDYSEDYTQPLPRTKIPSPISYQMSEDCCPCVPRTSVPVPYQSYGTRSREEIPVHSSYPVQYGDYHGDYPVDCAYDPYDRTQNKSRNEVRVHHPFGTHVALPLSHYAYDDHSLYQPTSPPLSYSEKVQVPTCDAYCASRFKQPLHIITE